MPVYVERLLDSNVPIQSQACMTPPCLLDSMFPSSTKHVPRHRVSRARLSMMFLVGLPNVMSKPTSMSRSRYHPVLWHVVGNTGYSMMFLVSRQACMSALFTRLHVSILNEACATPSCVPRSIVHYVSCWAS